MSYKYNYYIMAQSYILLAIILLLTKSINIFIKLARGKQIG